MRPFFYSDEVLILTSSLPILPCHVQQKTNHHSLRHHDRHVSLGIGNFRGWHRSAQNCARNRRILFLFLDILNLPRHKLNHHAILGTLCGSLWTQECFSSFHDSFHVGIFVLRLQPQFSFTDHFQRHSRHWRRRSCADCLYNCRRYL